MYLNEVVCSYVSGRLVFSEGPCFESRQTSFKKMISETIKKYKIVKDFTFFVSLDDFPSADNTFFHYTTASKNYIKTIPNYIFDGWPETGLKNFEKTCSSFINKKPLTNKCGFIGASTHQTRINFKKKIANNKNFDYFINEWVRRDPKNLHTNTKSYMSYQDQIDLWKYLIDIEGKGFSARLPVLLRSPRICFIVERPWEEFYYEHLKPWVHYVPVKRDLSDIENNYNKIEGDVELQNFISKNQEEFSKKYLTWDYALYHTYKFLGSL